MTLATVSLALLCLPAAGQPNQLGGLLSGPRSARGGRPAIEQVAAELDALQARAPNAADVREAVAAGRRALDAVAQARASGDRASAERKLQLAWAALALAQRRVDRMQAARRLAAALRRAQDLERRLKQAQLRTDAARRELQRAQEASR